MKTKDVMIIPLSKIIAGDHQLRKEFSDATITELAQSIKKDGILQPIIVRRIKKRPGFYMLVVGARRVRAAQQAGLKEIPAVISSISETDSFRVALVENIQRDDLTVFEEAYAIVYLMKYGGYKNISVLSRDIGKSQEQIDARLRILQLPKSVQEKVARGKVGLSQAVTISKIKDPLQQERAANLVANETLTADEITALVMNKATNNLGRLKIGDIVSPDKVLERLLALLGILGSANWSILGPESRAGITSQLKNVSLGLNELACAIESGDDLNNALTHMSGIHDDMSNTHLPLHIMLTCDHLEQYLRNLNWTDNSKDHNQRLTSTLSRISTLIEQRLINQKK